MCDVTPEMLPDCGVEATYRSVSQYGELLVRKDADEDFVYWLTRTLYENYEKLIAAAPGALKSLSYSFLDNSLDSSRNACLCTFSRRSLISGMPQ